MKKNIKEFFRQWDEGNFDLTEEAMGDLHPKIPVPETETDRDWIRAPIPRAAELPQRFFDKIYPAFSVLLAFILIFFLFRAVNDMPPFGSPDTPANSSVVVQRYLEKGLTETGAVNVVAGVILDYRAFDTLGESHVLFAAAAAVMILLLLREPRDEKESDRRILTADPVLGKTAAILIPLILMFGLYIILNGHLGPGGGFSGGAVMGGALILYSAAFGPDKLSRVLSFRAYQVTVTAGLLSYSLLKCYSFYCGANGLETIFVPGTPGAIFSAGLILPLNIAVGLVVSCTMYGFYTVFTRGRL